MIRRWRPSCLRHVPAGLVRQGIDHLPEDFRVGHVVIVAVRELGPRNMMGSENIGIQSGKGRIVSEIGVRGRPRLVIRVCLEHLPQQHLHGIAGNDHVPGGGRVPTRRARDDPAGHDGPGYAFPHLSSCLYLLILLTSRRWRRSSALALSCPSARANMLPSSVDFP